MNGKEIVTMRMDGKTFQEIAEFYGVSRQAVHEKFNSYLKILDGERGKSVNGKRFNINTIPYKGLYEYFERNDNESICSFCEKILGREPSNFVSKMRCFLTGKSDSHFTIAQINSMCRVVGKPFEEVFEEREVCCNDR